ncbi:MAG: transglutaminaseTgpA domain-containing protein [Myxococcota bacterium]
MTQGMVPIRLMLLVLLALYSYAFRQWFGTSMLAVFWLLTWFPFHFVLDRIGQLIFALVGVAVAYVLVVVGPTPKHPLSDGFAVLSASACVWVLFTCILRLWTSCSRQGQRGTIFISLLGLIACGGQGLGWMYHLFALVHIGIAMWASALLDPSQPRLLRWTPKRRSLLLLATVLAGMGTSTLFVSLPYAYNMVKRYFDMAAFARTQTTGFGPYIRLGALRSVIQSKRVVLRVYGRFLSSLYLRGAVYARYTRSYWYAPSLHTKVKTLPTQTYPQTPQRLRVDYVSGEKSRYFAPLEATDLSAPSGVVRIHPLGLVFPQSGKLPTSLSFALRKRHAVPVLSPLPEDIKVSRRISKVLRALAQKWTTSGASKIEKLRQIQSRLLRDYRYSLSFTRAKGRAPIVDFLLHNKQGHCEYFATALALLARSVGIPTRVIGGFAVSEYNALGGYYIVRKQNAHAWVEAWFPQTGWQTFEATPASGLLTHMPKRASRMDAVTDWIKVQLANLRARLSRLSMIDVLWMIALFAALWVLIRLQRWWRERRAKSNARDPWAYRDPLPDFLALLEAAEQILPKHESESLEHYVQRIRQPQQPLLEMLEAAELFLVYAEFRYGKVGDVEALLQRIRNAMLLQQSSVQRSDAES